MRAFSRSNYIKKSPRGLKKYDQKRVKTDMEDPGGGFFIVLAVSSLLFGGIILGSRGLAINCEQMQFWELIADGAF
ncbi:hypothetical protein FUAX_10090 [Fulvitalea axinellae]|uniref:Uncharacterized protein n=1 Tax=Fulvitalea axinellae TaxID=1182444 RepID=A0AAU9CKX2_9BACT|nr:hypothetical protein FUAX_10090 [Fulvitalea axinellae]